MYNRLFQGGSKGMNCKILSTSNNWRAIADAARTTVGKEAGQGEPSSTWKRKILMAEHSPIRKLIISWKWTYIPSWVSVHFVRHKIGIEHFVRSQREDRTHVKRKSQGELIEHECMANAQAIINISRKRLCHKASAKTRGAWKIYLEELDEVEPELFSVCVPECIYRGFCPELNSCGYDKTDLYLVSKQIYRGLK